MVTAKPLPPDQEENEKGGRGSKRTRWYWAMDPRAIMVLAEHLRIGAERYEVDNWRKVDVIEHLDHLANHLFKVLVLLKALRPLEEDREGIFEHLRAIQTRAHMALAVWLDSGRR